MPSHVALLRGVNVGGRSSLPMADLRRIATDLGWDDVATYIQSGNLVFTAKGPATALAVDLEHALASGSSVSPAVVVLTRKDLRVVVDANPFAHEVDHKKVHAAFATKAFPAKAQGLAAQAVAEAAERGSRDQATIHGRVMYLHTPDGLGRSVLADLLGRARYADVGTGSVTMRNWATVTRLLAMLDA